nr:dTDP-4-dehydrorhamnose reductase [Salinisphaera sp.]
MSGSERTRVLVTGADGQLGRALCRSGEERGVNIVALARADLDICDRSSVHEIVRHCAPTHIINAAAYTAVDAAESDADAAYAVNSEGPAHLAEAARDIGCRLFHVSTDFVFDGGQGKPYTPDGVPNPLNVYGASKLAGEKAIVERLGDSAFILRTAWVYSLQGRNFLTTMFRLMRERSHLRVVEDQVSTPTSAESLAIVLWRSIEKGLSGMNHWTDGGVASWYDFAVAIAEEGNARGLLTTIPEIAPVPSSEFPTVATRPAFSTLDKTRTRARLDYAGRHWRAELRAVLTNA